jgi:SpoVK/Ycf46/Vps4 family AAA+-type ATPase
MKSKLILSALALSLLPAQLCAMFAGPNQVEIVLSEKSAVAVNRVMKEFGAGIENELTPKLDSLIRTFGKGGANALETLGHGGAKGLHPIGNEIAIILAKYAAVTMASAMATQYLTKYIAKYLFEPTLIEKCSSYWTYPFKAEIKLADHMVISDKLSQDLNYIMKMTKNIKKNGGHFENVLLYGEPGTGKTLFAQLLAQECGMAYAFVPAANVSKFLNQNSTSTAAHELDQLFEWAAGKSNGTILFFDEAETFLAQRSTLNTQAQNALAAFLAKTGTPSGKIMIICATNRPEIMDDAVLSRLGYKVEFPLPDLKAREDQLAMHVKKIFAKQEGTQIAYDLLKDPASLTRIAQQLEGCSGRSIQKAVNRLRQTALAEDATAISQEIITRVIAQVQKDRIKPTVIAPAA